MDQEGNDLPVFGSSVLVQQVVDKATKPPVKTSELYVFAATFLAGVLHDKLGFSIDPAVMLSLVGLAGAYILGRSWAKAGLHKLAGVLVALGATTIGKELEDVAA